MSKLKLKYLYVNFFIYQIKYESIQSIS